MKEILTYLFEHKSLTKKDAKEVLTNIAKGKYNEPEIAAFVTVYLMRNITVEELSGFRDALLELCIPLDLSDFNTIDVCGTGGDSRDTFNISTLTAFVVAGAGYHVSKHGNYSVSSNCGSSNVMEYYGYSFSNEADKLQREMDVAGITFLHAPLFNPAMKNVAPVRKSLRMKTFFNMLGPMVNPSFPNHQLVGVFSLEVARIYNYIYQDSGKKFTILHSLDGYDEISLTGPFKVYANNWERTMMPDDTGLKTLQPIELHGGVSVEDSAKIFMDVLGGNGTLAQESVVLANAAFAIMTIDSGVDFDTALEHARSSLKSGKALSAFKKLIDHQ